jgi:MFS family permease
MVGRHWRKPGVILSAAAATLMISLGARQSFGLFLAPMCGTLGWGRGTFSLAIALQNLVWGLAQPFVGVVADRYGAGRVLAVGGALYAAGLALMARSVTGVDLDLSAGLLIGLGLSATSFAVVLGVVGRSVPPERRSAALGIAGAGGSFGQFIMLPYAQVLISEFGWSHALSMIAASALLIVPLGAVLAGRGAVREAPSQSVGMALRETAAHGGFWLLTGSLFVCGFQTVFIMVHLPSYIVDRGGPAIAGATALAVIGFFNIVGTFLAGFLGDVYKKKYLLSAIYAIRTVAVTAYIVLPISTASTLAFAAIMGLTWLGTVPLTNALIAQIFGVQYLSTLFGIAFLGHQVGGFLGAWSGGYFFDVTGSYAPVWTIAIAASVIAGLACLPVDERSLGVRLAAKGVA